MSMVLLAVIAAQIAAAALPARGGPHVQLVADSTAAQQAIIIRVKLAGPVATPAETNAIEDVEGTIDSALRRAKLGTVDGDEFGGGFGVITLYGADANRMYEAIKPILARWTALKGGTVTRRLGPQGAREQTTKY